MSESVRIKINPDDKMVEIPINDHHVFNNRVEIDLMLNFESYSTSEDEASNYADLVAQDIADDLKRYIAKRWVYFNASVTNDVVKCHESELIEEE